MKDSDCVQLVLASAARDPSDLINFMFTSQIANAVLKNRKLLHSVSVTVEEWDALFGQHARPIRPVNTDKTFVDASFLQQTEKLKTCLRTTVCEKSQGAIWARPWTRAACLTAMHFENHEEFLASCLGNVVGADSRRLEDMRSDLDDEGTSVMLLSELLAALAESVV